MDGSIQYHNKKKLLHPTDTLLMTRYSNADTCRASQRENELEKKIQNGCPFQENACTVGHSG